MSVDEVVYVFKDRRYDRRPFIFLSEYNMKTKTIVASAVGLLGIAAMALGTSTFAANTTTT